MGATGVGVPGQPQPLAREATSTRRRGKQPAVSLNLPPGFRFYPTDEELALHYLVRKALDREFTAAAMGDVDLNKFEPWELKGQVKMVGGTQQNPEMYLFYERGRKYPTGTRTNRATTCGYWKATGKDKEIYTRVGNRRLLVGMKKTLVFYTGRAPRGGKTDWVMHEYRLEKADNHPERSYWAAVLNGESVKLEDDWVVCRVFLKPKSANKRPSSSAGEQPVEADSDDVSDDPSADEPPPLVEHSSYADRGTGVDVKYKAEGTIATPAEMEAPARTPLSSQIQNMAAALNWNHLYTGGPFSFLNDTQNPPMMMMGGSTMGSGLYTNTATNLIQPNSCFYTPPFSSPPGGSMNSLLPLVDNNDSNLVYGLNPVNNVGDPFITGPLQQSIMPPIRMIPTPQAPRQCKEEELPIFPSPEEMLSPESTIMSGAGCSYPSPGGSSFQQMTSGGGGSIYGDAAADDDLFPPGLMMDVPNNWP